VPIVEGYGLTETAPVVISNALNIKDWTGTIGLPIPSTDATVLDDAGNELPQGEVGEISVRGPQVMKGYCSARRNREVFTKTAGSAPATWLRDEKGYFKITDARRT